MIDFLLRLYPPTWRDRYGDEMRDLLDHTTITPVVVWDVVTAAATERVRARPGPVRPILALVLFALADAAAVAGGVTDNILWAPTTPVRALVLVLTILPVAWAATAAIRDRATASTAA